MSTLIILATACVVSSTVLALYVKPIYKAEDAENIFKDFVEEYKKVYNLTEYAERLKIFKETLNDINGRNNEFPNTVYAVNSFSDLNAQERQNYFGFKLPNKNITEGIVSELVYSYAPVEFDWRDKNAVSPVKNQGSCQASYIFSAVGNIEGQYAIKHGQCLSFSTGHVLDCLDYGRCGGEASDMGAIMQVSSKKKKLERAQDYPYISRKKRCEEELSKGVVQLASCKEMILLDEQKIKEKLVLYGPLSIALDGNDFFHYKKGILEPKTCSAGLNLGMLLVGYGEENGVEFWILKNSWGTGWGEEGYARMLRGTNACGIGSYMALSTVY